MKLAAALCRAAGLAFKGLGLAFTGLGVAFAGAEAAVPLPPSPFPILAPRATVPGFVDAASPCLPGAGRDALAGARERVASGDLEGARHAFETAARNREADPEAHRDAALAAATLEARTGSGLEPARTTLAAALRAHPEGGARSCARLELVRQALRERRVPAARAELARVERDRAGAPGTALAAATRVFYRAEVALLEGRRAESAAAYRDPALASAPRLALAARLRLADLAPGWPRPAAGGEAESEWKQVRALLREARERGIDIAGWSARAAELAIAAGRLEEAHRWLARAEGLDPAGVASIRKADVLVALDRREDARVVLTRVAAASPHPAARDLARVRIDHFRLGPEGPEERAERLRRAARSLHPEVSALARDALAVLLLEEGELANALAELARLAHSGAIAAETPRFQHTLGAALRAATRPELDCPRVLERLGGRRALFVRLGPEPGPALRLGDCFLELGMPGQALEVYRGLARRFGAGPATGLPLRIGRASLEAGDLPVLRATLRAHEAGRTADAEGKDADADARWRWLAAQLALQEGRPDEAADRMLSLARVGPLAPELRVEVERALAALDPETVDADLLGRTLAASLAHPIEGVAPERRAEAWLRLADLQRERGRAQVARAAYRRAGELLPEGARRNRVAFRLAMLQDTPGGTRRALEELAEADPGAPWARLAGGESRLIRLRAAASGGTALP